MGTRYGGKIVTDGLVLCLDAHDAKSYAGEPTTNFLYRLTPRIDSSYSTYVHASNSTWAANHPTALRVYNTDGTEVSSFVNQGANSGNWQVISHAHWVYDNDLKKPVVKMHPVSGYEGQWRALNNGLNHTLSQLGLTAGDKFTISWLQKAYVEGVYARAGMYMRNSSNSYNFHAGQAYSSDVGQLSSELGKWAHKSKTFTVPSGMDETVYKVALYMYGHYSPTSTNTIYISDVQVELGDYATPIVQGVSSSNGGYWGTRSATNGWVDRSGNSNSGTLTNMVGTGASHYRDGQVIMPVSASYLDFDGSNDHINVNHNSSFDTNTFTIEVWFKSTADDNTHDSLITRNADVYSSTNGWSLGKLRNGLGSTTNALRWLVWGTSTYTDLGGDSTATGNWTQAVGVSDGTNLYLYQNGVQKASGSKPAGNIYPSSYGFKIGANKSSSDIWNGQIAKINFYSKALTAAEVLSNYNTTKGRYL